MRISRVGAVLVALLWAAGRGGGARRVVLVHRGGTTAKRGFPVFRAHISRHCEPTEVAAVSSEETPREMAGLIPPELMKLASKVLGYGVVAGATFVKIPQARSR